MPSNFPTATTEASSSRDHAPPITAVASGQAHTPGPWLATEATNYFGITGKTQVARTAISPNSVMRDEGLANARLIAAAPELLEVARGLVAWDEDERVEAPLKPIIEMACAAIAKAEGAA